VLTFSGDLVGVVGAVGTGKSSVLAAVLGELEKTSGRIALDRPPQGTRSSSFNKKTHQFGFYTILL